MCHPVKKIKQGQRPTRNKSTKPNLEHAEAVGRHKIRRHNLYGHQSEALVVKSAGTTRMSHGGEGWDGREILSWLYRLFQGTNTRAVITPNRLRPTEQLELARATLSAGECVMALPFGISLQVLQWSRPTHRRRIDIRPNPI